MSDPSPSPLPKIGAVTHGAAGCFPVVLLISSLVLLSVLIYGWNAYQHSLPLQAQGIATVTWTDTRESCDNDGCNTSYTVDYLFIAPDGQRYNGSDSLGYANVKEGDLWPIRYDPVNPANFQSEYTYWQPEAIVAETKRNLLWLATVAAFFLLITFRSWYNYRQFMSQSRLVPGVIARLWQNVTEDGEGVQQTQHWLAYTFPDGQETRQAITGHQFFRLDLGDTIIIRYLPKQPHCSQVEWKRTLTEKSHRLAAPQLEQQA